LQLRALCQPDGIAVGVSLAKGQAESMFLDVTTLVFINAFIAAVSGTLLVLAWSAYRDMKPVLWWAAASLLQGLAHALLPLSAMLAVDALRPVGWLASSAAPPCSGTPRASSKATARGRRWCWRGRCWCWPRSCCCHRTRCWRRGWRCCP